MALTALPVFGFGTFGQGHNLMVGKHSGLVSQLPAGAAQWLATSVAVVHHPGVLYEKKRKKKRIKIAIKRQSEEMLMPFYFDFSYTRQYLRSYMCIILKIPCGSIEKDILWQHGIRTLR